MIATFIFRFAMVYLFIYLELQFFDALSIRENFTNKAAPLQAMCISEAIDDVHPPRFAPSCSTHPLYLRVISATACSVGSRSPLDPDAKPTASVFVIDNSALFGSLNGPPLVMTMTSGFAF
jgi:hypothetical protein